MRFHDFSLKYYGGFEHKTFSFPTGAHDFHIIYGLNEAGKSTLLRAFRDFLFGFHQHTQGENWKYSTSLIRLGATFSHDGHTQTAWRRRPATKRGDFFDEDDATPLNPALLIQAYGQLTREEFFLSWALDHTRLAEGGKEVAHERQNAETTNLARELGNIDNLSDIIASLEKEKSDSWDKKRRNPRIKELIKNYHDTKKALRDATTSPQKLKEAQATVQHHNEHYKSLHLQNNTLIEQGNDYAHLQALIGPHTSYQEAKRLVDERAQSFFDKNESETIISLFDARHSSHQQIAKNNALLENRKKELATLGVRPSLLDDEKTLMLLSQEALNDAQHQREFQERERTYTKLDQKRTDLFAHLSLSEESSFPTLAQLKPLSDLLERYAEITARLKERQRTLAYTSPPEELPQAPNIEQLNALKDWLNTAIPYAQLDTEHDTLMSTLATQKRSIITSLEALAPWTGAFEEADTQLQRLTPPSEEECQNILSIFNAYTQQAREAVQRAMTAQHAYDRHEQHYQQFSHAPEWVSEATLNEARQKRDYFFNKIDKETFISSWKGLKDLIHHTDHLADQRFLSAQTDAHLRDIRRQQELLTLDIRHAKQEETTALSALQEEQEKWNKRLNTAGLPILTPHQFSTWRQQRTAILARYDTYYDTQEKMLQLARKRQQLIEQFKAIIPHHKGCDISQLISISKRNIEELSSEQKHYDHAVREHHSAQKNLITLKANLADAERERKEWHDEWTQAAQRSGYPLTLSPDALPAYQDLIKTQQDFQYISEEKQNKESERLKRQQQRTQLLERHQAASLDALEKTLEAAKRDDKQRDILLKQKKDREEALIELEEDAKILDDRLSRFLLRLPEGSTLDDLLKTAQRDSETAQLATSYHAAKRALLNAGRGRSLDDIIAALGTLDYEQLDEKKALINKENTRLENEKSIVSKQLFHAQQELEQLEKKDEASALAEELQHLKARIEEEAKQYVSLHAQYQLLQHMLYQQKEKLHGPFLSLASTCFSRLTLGEYAELALESDNKGTLTFIGLRPDKQEAVPLPQMSEGTCDQLYLALRLADIHQKLDAGISLPFFADDLFITFDDKRTKAGMELLAELSQRTQVFFFTHQLATLDHLPPEKAQRLALSAHS
ncbi:AAA family ATPase [Saccharibacter floricola]|uniref:YhaN AAA domain-containing protein n=1 Tax=Saccharibacter floricola DSM 15669 TaxID=1123227 RepID=A0ABQ0NWU6_9PROT|nr:AAA family ATPase [Saccharibacter floricola]GBQ05123.1 hypothetical protein AA15669_0314 [Saccharibacter floricola DSM 15669]